MGLREAEDLAAEELEEVAQRLKSGPPSPLLQAKIVHARQKTRETEVALRQLEADLAQLRDPETSWEDRARVIDHLRTQGWASLPCWSDVERAWKYGGKEWRISLAPDDFDALSRLEGTAYSAYLTRIIRQWLQENEKVKDRVLDDAGALHFFTVWVAFHVWGCDETYSRWIMEEIVDSALGGVGSGRLPAAFQASGVNDRQKADLRQEGYLYLVSASGA